MLSEKYVTPGMNTMDSIQNRISVRRYSDSAIDDYSRQEMERCLQSAGEGPFGSKPRFKMLNIKPLSRDEQNKLGSYGFIRGAHLYILGAVKDQEGALIDLGFCMEKIILKATRLGLETCWLGGTFKRTAFASKMDLADEELLPAITPVGYAAKEIPAEKRKARFKPGSKKRRPWTKLFFEADGKTPLTEKAAGPFSGPLEAVRMAPSTSNRQPWRIIKESEGCFHLYLKEHKIINRFLSKIQLQNIDMGIAMCHFDLVARERGLPGQWLKSFAGSELSGLQYIATWKK